MDVTASDSVMRRSTDWLSANPFAADVLLTIVLLALGLSVAFTVDISGTERELDLVGLTVLGAMIVPIAWRRRAPIIVAWVTVLATTTYWVLDFPDEPTGPSVLIALFGLGAHEDRRRALSHFSGALAVLLAVMSAGVLFSGEDLPWVSLPTGIILFVGAWILGDNVRTRRNYLLELEEKAARTEAQRLAEAQRAVQEERARIARELHDVVAHSMSVMVVQAGAARRVLDHHPAQTAEALEAIEVTGRESLTEMRRVLGVLRGEDGVAELTPAPGLDDFDRLLKQCEEAGLPVELAIEGDARRLAPGLELSAYRIVQESLTNSLKHAGPARATVTLDYRHDALVINVADDGRGAMVVSGGSGQGLIGMKERVDAFGGELAAGPQGGGGYRVTATFPIPTMPIERAE